MLLPDNDVNIIGGTAGQACQEFPQTLPRDFTLTITLAKCGGGRNEPDLIRCHAEHAGRHFLVL
jgi:hypothetical protein